MASDPHGLRKMTNHKLYEWTGGWKVGSQDHLAGQAEIKRRHQKPSDTRSRASLWIVAGSLLVAVGALAVALLIFFDK